MTVFEALLLGILQGFTEFLPVSSSGHLALGQYLLGFRNLNELVPFTLACHLGTLLAVLVFFHQQIFNIFQGDYRKIGWVIIGTLPLLPLVILAEPLKSLFDKVNYLGIFFLFTAFLLFIGTRFGQNIPDNKLEKRRIRDSFIIGLFQAGAIFPGVSRSGSTIAGARLLGWLPQEAVTFSFLLSIPAILGGSLLEFGKVYLHPELISNVQMSFSAYFAGFISAFIVGCGALALLVKVVQNNKLSYFAWYCLILGVISLVYFNY